MGRKRQDRWYYGIWDGDLSDQKEIDRIAKIVPKMEISDAECNAVMVCLHPEQEKELRRGGYIEIDRLSIEMP